MTSLGPDTHVAHLHNMHRYEYACTHGKTIQEKKEYTLFEPINDKQQVWSINKKIPPTKN